jgi:hypothetical protein
MAQRTEFPNLPNKIDAQYLPTMQEIFAELTRSGGQLPFKTFRSWLKERNLYNKEEVDDLLNMLGCESKPNVVLGPFGREFLAAETPEAQQRLLYRWLNAWNPFLTKYVFEAVDVEGGGRLHSTHELFRMISSYVYPGDDVRLPAFQSWIRWMAASGYIKYIGIRWGLSEAGKLEMQTIRQVDVDELLEDEAEEKAAGAPQLPEFGDAPETAPESAQPTDAAPAAETAPAAQITTNTSAPAQNSEEEELPPDMPPEPTARTWTPPPTVEAPTAAPIAVGAQRSAAPAWFGAAPAPANLSAAEVGITAAKYKKSPQLGLFHGAVGGLLVTSGIDSDAWRPFLQSIIKLGVLKRYLLEDESLESILEPLGWFEAKPEFRPVFSWIALDLMRMRATLAKHPKLAETLAAAEPGDALLQTNERLFGSGVTGAALWLSREFRELGVWKKAG